MNFLFSLLLLVGVTVVPIMVGARAVQAKKEDFGSALLAVFFLAFLGLVTHRYITSPPLAWIVVAAGGAAILAEILGTTFWRGLGISIIGVVVQFVVIFLFAGTVAGPGTAS